MSAGRIVVGADFAAAASPQQWYKPNWSRLEQVYDCAIPELVKDQISFATIFFGRLALLGTSTKRKSEIIKHVKAWQKTTENLFEHSGIVLLDPKLPKKITPEVVSKKFNQSKWGSTGRNGPDRAFSYFADSLETALASSNLMLLGINQAKASRVKDQWEVWVSIVRTSFIESGLRATASSGDKHPDHSKFVKFIEAFQMTLPKECRRFSDATTIAKGIQSATRRFGSIESKTLLWLIYLLAVGQGPESLRRIANNNDEVAAVIRELLRLKKREPGIFVF
ncbi:MAG: hypothetical protein RO009_04210 [Pseudorhodoplanes sp.]|jgi:hypothetical protein|nr:hypothetical protein [Pseudorhodoplanes sp.]